MTLIAWVAAPLFALAPWGSRLSPGAVAPNAAVASVDFEHIARDLIDASPVVDDGDSAARDRAGEALARCATLLDACDETIEWGGYDPEVGYDPRSYTLTLFAPMVWARLYLSQFMFTGEQSIRTEGPFQVLELGTKFRRNLDPGDFPYPFWHSPAKWRDYVNAKSVILVARNDRIVAAYRRPDPNAIMLDRRWDGRWHWEGADGQTEPHVTLFEYLLSEDNPHRAPLEESYRKLADGFRSQHCVSCHAPDNPEQASPLVMLLYPNQSLGARHRLVEELSRNRMPPRDPVAGTPRGIPDPEARQEFVALAQDFAREGDAALAFERDRAGAPTAPPTAATDDRAEWKVLSDDWYTLTLAGVHAGWMRVAREDDGTRFRTVTEMRLAYHQSGTQLDADSYAQWVETHDGQPLHLEVARRSKEKRTNFNIGNVSAWEQTRDGDPLGLLTSKRSWEFDGDHVTSVVEGDDGPVHVASVKPPGPWLTPAAAERFIARRIGDDARTLEYGTVDAPDQLRYVGVKSTLVGHSEFAFEGKLIPTTVWRTKTSANPAQTISHYSRDGRLVYSSVNLGIGVLETRRSSRAGALAQVGTPAHASLPPVPADQAVTGASRTVYDVYLEGGLLPSLPSAGAQTVEELGDGHARVTVDVTRTSSATSPELVEGQLRERAPVVGSDDSVVLELAARSIREAPGIGGRELADSSWNVVRRQFVAQSASATSISIAGGQLPDVRISDATGEEAARVLAAVLRVHRIASRVVAGLAYQPGPEGKGAFRWRVWTQALLDGQWVDMDPTGAERFDSGHILMGVAGVDAPNPDPDPMEVTGLLSNLQIRVLSQTDID